MGKLFILTGAPGSGKSTWVKNHMTLNDSYISRDDVRFSMVPEGDEYFSKEKEVFKEFIRRIDEDLKFHNVFADATHLTAASRNKLLRAISTKPDAVEVIWIKTPLDVALDQNENRKETRSYVPRGVIRRMHCQIEKPEFEEGIDKIYIVEPNKDIQIIERK